MEKTGDYDVVGLFRAFEAIAYNGSQLAEVTGERGRN